jgi:hypothetical protein
LLLAYLVGVALFAAATAALLLLASLATRLSRRFA